MTPASYYHSLLNASTVAAPTTSHVESFFTGNRIVLPASSVFTTVPGDWTVEAWINIADFKNYLTIIGFGTGGDEFGFFHYKSAFFAPGTIKIYQSGSGGDTIVGTPGLIPINTWTHAAVSRRASDGKFCTYVNGAPDITNGTPLAAQTNAIGNSLRCLAGDGGGEQLQGGLSDVRIWNVQRSAAQILANYNRRLTGGESGLIGYWRMDDGPVSSGTTAADSTSGAHNGTLTSPPNCAFVASGPVLIP